MRTTIQRMCLLLMVTLVAITGCRNTPRTADDVVSVTTAAYNLGCVALEVATAASATWFDSIDAPTDTDVARGKQIVATLAAVQATLTRAHTAIMEGREALVEVRQALGLLRVVTSLFGAQAPPGLETALAEAEHLVGGAP